MKILGYYSHPPRLRPINVSITSNTFSIAYITRKIFHGLSRLHLQGATLCATSSLAPQKTTSWGPISFEHKSGPIKERHWVRYDKLKTKINDMRGHSARSSDERGRAHFLCALTDSNRQRHDSGVPLSHRACDIASQACIPFDCGDALMVRTLVARPRPYSKAILAQLAKRKECVA